MNRPSDETLMAFADGALEPEEMARIADYIETDAEARATVEAFRRSRELLSGAYDAALLAPVPDRLMEAIMAGSAPDVPAAGGAPGKVVDLASRRSARQDERPAVTGWRPVAMAASVAVLAGVAIGWLAGVSGRSADPNPLIAIGPLAPSSTLASLLEGSASHQQTALPRAVNQPDTALVAVSTFRDRSDRPCREFELVETAELRPLAVGVACRGAAGQWVVEGVVQTVAQQATGQGMKPASGVTEPAAVDGLMRMLGAGLVLRADEERALIGRQWKP